MSAKYEAFSFLGFLAFAASAPLIAIAATGHWNRWLIGPFVLMGITGFWIWMNWLIRKGRTK